MVTNRIDLNIVWQTNQGEPRLKEGRACEGCLKLYDRRISSVCRKRRAKNRSMEQGEPIEQEAEGEKEERREDEDPKGFKE